MTTAKALLHKELDMKNDASQLRQEANDLRSRLQGVENLISKIERECPHLWSTTQSTEEYNEWREDLSRPIRHGVHLEYEMKSVKASRPVWTRTCNICGKCEKTAQTRDNLQVSKLPVF